MAKVRHMQSMNRKQSRWNIILALLGVTTFGVYIGIPSTDSLDITFAEKGSSLNGKEISSCSKMNFPLRSPKEDHSYRKAWIRTMHSVMERKLTFLDEVHLALHRELLSEIELQGIPGMIFECGVAKAGSAILFASLKHPERCLHLFDTFDGIPEPSSKDGLDVLQRYKQIQTDKLNCKNGGSNCNKEYYGNFDDLLAYDKKQFEITGYPSSKNAVFFHKGLFNDTVWPEGSIALAHLVSIRSKPCTWNHLMDPFEELWIPFSQIYPFSSIHFQISFTLFIL